MTTLEITLIGILIVLFCMEIQILLFSFSLERIVKLFRRENSMLGGFLKLYKNLIGWLSELDSNDTKLKTSISLLENKVNKIIKKLS